MPKIVILSKESKTYFSFDNMHIIKNGKPIGKEMTKTPLEVFRYLAECSPDDKTHDDIYKAVWIEKLKKKTEIDKFANDVIKQHTMAINSYFRDVYMDEIIKSGPKTYTCIVGVFDTDSDPLIVHLNELDLELNAIIDEYEAVIQKINRASKNCDSILLDMYYSQSDLIVKKYNSFKEKIDIINREIHDSQWIYEIIDVNEKNYDQQNKQKSTPKYIYDEIEHKSDKANDKIMHLQMDIEEKILDYWCHTDSSSSQDIVDLLDELPKGRKTALLLLRVCNNLCCEEVYEKLFTECREYLDDYEYEHLAKAAKFNFEEFVWERWGI